MSQIKKIITINASPETIMEYVSDVNNHPAFIPPLKSISNIDERVSTVGTTWDWTFVMAGIEFVGKSEAIKYEAGKVLSYKTTGGIVSTFTYSVEAGEDGTQLTMEVVYETPESLVGKANLAAIEKINSESAEAAEENIKAILEN